MITALREETAGKVPTEKQGLLRKGSSLRRVWEGEKWTSCKRQKTDEEEETKFVVEVQEAGSKRIKRKEVEVEKQK